MTSFAFVLTGAVALLHFYFLVLEMFLWTRPLGLKSFRQSLERATITASLAKNMGLYNGFLAAGLVWGLVHADPLVGEQLRYFFLGCVAVAGAFGGYTVNRRIFVIQGVPALLAIALFAL